MSGNVHRGTAARLLIGFAALIFVASLVSLRLRWDDGLEYLEFPTALEDTAYYDPLQGLGLETNDFWHPNLVFEERPGGLFRRNHQPQERPDGTMYRVGKFEAGRLNVYAPVERNNGITRLPEGDQRRFFLKTGPNLYIEFGEQRYWPKFQEP